MATRIFLRHGNGKPLITDFDTINGRGELLIDLQNKTIWTVADDGGNPTVVELGATDISGETIDWNQIDPSTYPPGGFTPAAHRHSYGEVTTDGTGTSKTLATEVSEILAELSRLDGEITALEGNLAFGGTAKASNGQITQVTAAGAAAGFIVGPIPSTPPVGSENIYFILEDGGVVDSVSYSSGDWLVSEGATNGWTAIHFDSPSVLWSEIAGKPATFPPDPHSFHTLTDVHEAGNTSRTLDILLNEKAASSHGHGFGDITASGGAYDGLTLEEALNTKADIDIIQGGNY